MLVDSCFLGWKTRVKKSHVGGSMDREQSSPVWLSESNNMQSFNSSCFLHHFGAARVEVQLLNGWGKITLHTANMNTMHVLVNHE